MLTPVNTGFVSHIPAMYGGVFLVNCFARKVVQLRRVTSSSTDPDTSANFCTFSKPELLDRTASDYSYICHAIRSLTSLTLTLFLVTVAPISKSRWHLDSGTSTPCAVKYELRVSLRTLCNTTTFLKLRLETTSCVDLLWYRI